MHAPHAGRRRHHAGTPYTRWWEFATLKYHFKSKCVNVLRGVRHRQKLYKTGDLGRWLGNKNLEFLGRIDQQVKIRGFRVETGEIENLLLKHPEVKEILVLTKETETGENYLCAYFVSGKTIPCTEIREYLSKYVPGYMIPTYFIQIEQIPLTPNGKIDKKVLPIPGIKPGVQFKAPRDKIEIKLVDIWSEILGIKKDIISIDANFFRLGGHSIKANLLILRIRKEFNTPVPLIEVFKSPSIQLCRLATLKSRAPK